SVITDAGDHYDVPSNSKISKFKIFRTGEIQLPGVKPHLIQDVVIRSQCIAKMMDLYLAPRAKVTLKRINPVMKNYKFTVKLPLGALIDLTTLKRSLKQIQPVNAPKIFDVKYTREDTKLSIKFNTPVHKKAKKCTRVNIFMRGKVNILGASDVE